MERSPRVSVVIATLRRPEVLRRALDSLCRSATVPCEVVVVDGDEQLSALPVVQAAGQRAPFPMVHVPSPRGGTIQRNIGLGLAAGDIVLFIDDDARVSADALGTLTAAYAEADVVGATGKVVEPHGNRVVSKSSRVRRLLPGGGTDGTFTRFGYPRRLRDEDKDQDVEFMQGCFMSGRTDIARAVGFDEYLVNYSLAEDEDFSYRLSRHGRIRYVAGAVVHHDNTGFANRDRRKFGHLVVRNRAYLFKKNFPQSPMARAQFALLLALLVLHRLLNGDLTGARGIAEAALRRILCTARRRK